jgi:manganese/zinc/iron transport system substrate-binding protein
MIADLARQIGGDRLELEFIMGPGVDPHVYKPSTSDFGKLKRADLVLYNGLHLEGKMVELFEEELKDRSVAVASGIAHNKLLEWQAGNSAAHDPHIWFDATLWASAAQTVGDALGAKDPAHAVQYKAKAAEVVANLQKLHQYAQTRFDELPESRRVLITSHDAYNYFGRAYGVKVMGLQGISTETEAGLNSINSAVDFIVKNNIPAIFVESSVSHKTIERVQADCKAKGFEVKIGGELYSDAMGAPGEHQGYAVETYEGMFRYNVDTIVGALK